MDQSEPTLKTEHHNEASTLPDDLPLFLDCDTMENFDFEPGYTPWSTIGSIPFVSNDGNIPHVGNKKQSSHRISSNSTAKKATSSSARNHRKTKKSTKKMKRLSSSSQYRPKTSDKVVQKFHCRYPKCGKVFTKFPKFLYHKLTHRKRFTCDARGCTERFKRVEDLKTHLKEHQRKKQETLDREFGKTSKRGYKFKCPVLGCYLAFTRNTTLKIHERLKHDSLEPLIVRDRTNKYGREKVLKCKYEYCLKFFTRNDDLRRHMKIHSEDNPYPCVFDFCELRFKYPKNVDTHIIRSHPGDHQFKCKYPGCGKVYPRYIQLSRHEPIHVEEKRFKCTEEGCNKMFTTAFYRNSHRWKCHQPKRLYECSICHGKFKSNYNLTKHQKIHLKESVDVGHFPCIRCKETLSRRLDLLNHMNEVHGEQVSKVCDICWMTFRYKKDYDKHMMYTHNSEEVVDGEKLCPHCGVVTANSIALKEHMTIHDKALDGMRYTVIEENGATVYKCLDCNKNFKQLRYLKNHRFVHFPESHQCAECGKVFKCGKYLREHQQVHNEDRQYTCNVCSKTYKTQKDMLRHRETHSEERNHHCPYVGCGRSYKTRSTLRIHMHCHRKNEQKNKPFNHGNLLKAQPSGLLDIV